MREFKLSLDDKLFRVRYTGPLIQNKVHWSINREQSTLVHQNGVKYTGPSKEIPLYSFTLDTAKKRYITELVNSPYEFSCFVQLFLRK